jgi:putative ABC transport system substrate-binding protein
LTERSHQLKRRKFITLVGGAAAAWPLAARAQQEAIRPLIGLLSPLSAAAATRNVAAFRSALRDHDYVEGRNMTLALRFGEGAPERMELLAASLLRLSLTCCSPARSPALRRDALRLGRFQL